MWEAKYTYDPAGRVEGIAYGWGSGHDNYGAGWFYDWTGIKKYTGEYEGQLGLKSASKRLSWNNTSHDWNTSADFTETYGYEAARDFLTSASYSDDSSYNGTWTYDGAGNRASQNSNTSFSYDNLNRITSSPNSSGTHSYEHDAVGNRLWRDRYYTAAWRYNWDNFNRMTDVCGATTGARYQYRADGMRTAKVEGLTISWNGTEGDAGGHYDQNWASNKPTTRYYYDGQMPVQEDHTYTVSGTTHVDLTCYGIGPRGIDFQGFYPQGSSSVEGYPLYDTHGNNVFVLKRSDHLNPVDERRYDAWGAIRSGSGAEQGHCANLGHRLDGESGLVYMRARYYEAATGRFVSEDQTIEGENWYVYARNNPIGNADFTGNSIIISFILAILKLLTGEVLIGDIDSLTSRLDTLTSRMAQLDELIAHEMLVGASTRGLDVGEEAMAIRREIGGILSKLRKAKMQRTILKWGSGIGNALGKLFGGFMIMSALIDDIDLGPSGYGALEFIHGD